MDWHAVCKRKLLVAMAGLVQHAAPLQAQVLRDILEHWERKHCADRLALREAPDMIG